MRRDERSGLFVDDSTRSIYADGLGWVTADGKVGRGDQWFVADQIPPDAREAVFKAADVSKSYWDINPPIGGSVSPDIPPGLLRGEPNYGGGGGSDPRDPKQRLFGGPPDRALAMLKGNAGRGGGMSGGGPSQSDLSFTANNGYRMPPTGGSPGDNPNLAQQATEWQRLRAERGEDPTDPEAFRKHVLAIGAPDPFQQLYRLIGG